MGNSPMERISGFWKSKKAMPLLVLGLLSVFLLALSLFGEGAEEREVDPVFDEAAYTEALEARLEALLGRVEGAGEVYVMLTVDSFYEEEYALDVSVETSDSEGSSHTAAQEEVVLKTEKNGVKSPIVKSRFLPRVRGVSVVCSGGGSAEVQRKIISLVQALFEVGANQISVTN